MCWNNRTNWRSRLPRPAPRPAPPPAPPPATTPSAPAWSASWPPAPPTRRRPRKRSARHWPRPPRRAPARLPSSAPPSPPPPSSRAIPPSLRRPCMARWSPRPLLTARPPAPLPVPPPAWPPPMPTPPPTVRRWSPTWPPPALSQPASTQSLIAAMVTAFNSTLSTGFANDAKVLLVDVYAVSHDQTVNPGPYGLTNVTTPACDLSVAKNPLQSSLVCNASNLISGDVSHYSFADTVHPTPFNNLLLARYVAEKMVIKGWL